MLLGTCSCAVVRRVLCALSGFAAPGGRCCLAPVRVFWLWPAACLSGVPRGPAWCAAPRPVWSLSRLSRRRGAFSYPRGLRPRLYWVAARGTRRPAEKGAHCARRWPPPRRGRWARSASYPFGAPRWGCPWRVPRASVLGCVRCGGWREWTRSLMRPVSRTVRRSTGDSAGAPGPFRVDAVTSPCGSEDATPGSRACVRVLALFGRVGRAGLPGAFCCASPFPLAALSFCFAWPLPGWGCPCPGPLLFFFGSVVFFFCALFVSCFLWFMAPGALGLGPLCCLFCWPRASWLSVRSRFLCVAWPLAALRRLPPPLPSLSLLLPFLVALRFFFLFPLLCASLVSGFLCFLALGALGLGGGVCLFRSALRALCFFLPPPPSVLRAFSPVLGLPVGRWLFPAFCSPPPSPSVSRGFRRWFFFFGL